MDGPFLNICIEHMDMSSLRFILTKIVSLPEVVCSHIVKSVSIYYKSTMYLQKKVFDLIWSVWKDWNIWSIRIT
jgi:hypothetical protein